VVTALAGDVAASRAFAPTRGACAATSTAAPSSEISVSFARNRGAAVEFITVSSWRS
jgi:hypothetical protein